MKILSHVPVVILFLILAPQLLADEAKPNLDDPATRNLDKKAAGERKLFDIGGQQVAFRWCPPTGDGGYLMGSPATEEGHEDNEKQHAVVLSKGYWLMETEVTQGLWQAVMGSNPSHFKKGDSYPVERVSWEDCQEFIRKVNAGSKLPPGVVAALPTEAQWEYACRAGTQTVFHHGNSLSSRQANFDGNYPYGGASKGPYKQSTVAVKSYQPNAWGLYDMHGSVWEWCADWYGGDYASGKQTDPPGATEGQLRVLRGGCWLSIARRCRSANRIRLGPVNRLVSFGFRVSLQVENQ